MIQKTLKRLRLSQSENYRHGIVWFQDVFYEQCIQKNIMLKDLEDQKEAEEERIYQRKWETAEIINSDKFRQNFVDDQDQRFKHYAELLDFERKIEFCCKLEEEHESIADRKDEVQRSITDFGDFIPTDLAIKICTTAQKIIGSCGLETKFTIAWFKELGKSKKIIQTDKFHSLRQILTQKGGFKLKELNLPEPTEKTDALLMHETGISSLEVLLQLKVFDKKSFQNTTDSNLLNVDCSFEIKPIDEFKRDSSLHYMYQDLSKSEDGFDQFKGDVIADILIERESIIADFLDLHSSWGTERKRLYAKLAELDLEELDLEELSDVIQNHILFRLKPVDGLSIWSQGDLNDYERTRYFDDNGTCFDDFDQVVIELLRVMGQTECPSDVDELEKRLSPSVFFALQVERFLAPYSKLGSEKTYRNLIYDIADENGLDLDTNMRLY